MKLNLHTIVPMGYRFSVSLDDLEQQKTITCDDCDNEYEVNEGTHTVKIVELFKAETVWEQVLQWVISIIFAPIFLFLLYPDWKWQNHSKINKSSAEIELTVDKDALLVIEYLEGGLFEIKTECRRKITQRTTVEKERLHACAKNFKRRLSGVCIAAEIIDIVIFVVNIEETVSVLICSLIAIVIAGLWWLMMVFARKKVETLNKRYLI